MAEGDDMAVDAATTAGIDVVAGDDMVVETDAR